MFQVPVPAPVTIPAQDVVLADDGTHPVQAVLGDVGVHSASALAAHLTITPMVADPKAKGSGAEIKGDPISLPAQSVTLDAVNHTLTLIFPNLSKLGVKGLAKGAANQIFVDAIACDQTSQLCPNVNAATLTAQFVSIPKATPNLTLLSEGNAIVEKSGTGSLPVVVKGIPTGETAGLMVTGAGVTGVTDSTGKTLSWGKNGYPLAADGVYTVSLTNLTSGAMVTVSVQGLKGSTSDGSDPATANYTAVADTTAGGSSTNH